MMDEYEALRQVISNATRYMRTYLAKVLDGFDPENKGRVQIIIPELGLLTAAEGVWADVEQPVGVNVSPAKDKWVSVYFLNGDPSKPVVRGILSIVKDNLPNNGDKKQVFYEDENTKIYYDEQNEKLSVETSYKVDIKCDNDVSVKGKNIKVQGDKVTVNDHLEVS